MCTVLRASHRDVIREASTSGRNLIIVNPCTIYEHTIPRIDVWPYGGGGGLLANDILFSRYPVRMHKSIR